MLQRRPHTVLLITPRGTVVIARHLFERLEARMEPNDLGLLRDHDWWRQLSELVCGIEFLTPVPHQESSR